MPGNVAVEWPDSSVILIPLKDDVRVRLKLSDVTSGWVGLVGYFAIPASTELLESLASGAISYNSTVVHADSVGSITSDAVRSTFQTGEVSCWRSARTTCTTALVTEDGTGVTAGSFCNDLDVVT